MTAEREAAANGMSGERLEPPLVTPCDEDPLDANFEAFARESGFNGYRIIVRNAAAAGAPKHRESGRLGYRKG